MALQSPPTLTAAERERMVAIYQGWQRARHRRTVSAFHRHSRFADQALSLAALSLLILSPLDCGLWRLQLPIAWSSLAPRSGLPVAALLVAVSMSNAFLLHGYLARKTPDERSWPVWLRALRFALAGVPLVGIYTIPAWRRCREIHPAWIRQRTLPEPVALETRGSSLSLTWQRWMGRLESFWTLIWVPLSGLGALLLAVCWLTARAVASPGRSPALIAVDCVLHLLFFAALFALFRSTARQRRLSRGRSLVLTALSTLWLLPIPFLPFAAGFLLYLRVSGDDAQAGSLIFQVLIHRQGTGRLPLWLAFEDELRHARADTPWWQLRSRLAGTPDRAPAAGSTERQIVRLYDLASYSLGFDAAGLSWALAWLARRQPGTSPFLRQLYGIALGTMLLAFFAAASLVAVDFLQRVLRISAQRQLLVRHPWAGYAAKGQFAALCGWLLGWALEILGAQRIGRLTMLCAALLIGVKGLSLILRPTVPKGRLRRGFRDDVGCVLVFASILILGGLSQAVDLLTPALAAWFLTYPLRSLLVGMRLIPPLLRPFRWRDLFSRQLSERLRALLAALALPALLPGGGLAVPAWIVVRQRWWSSAKSLWWQAERGPSGKGPA